MLTTHVINLELVRNYCKSLVFPASDIDGLHIAQALGWSFDQEINKIFIGKE